MTMRRKLLAATGVMLVFVILLVARLPASWVHSNFAAHLPLENVQGSVWQGQASLNHPQFPLEKIHWQLAALPLLLGKAQLEFRLEDAGISASGQLLASSTVQKLVLPRANLDATRVNALGLLPFGAEVGGDVLGKDIIIERHENAFTQAQGTVQWTPAYLISPQAVSLQAYLAVISHEEQQLVLHLSDQGGPLEIDGLAYVPGDLSYRYTLNMRLVDEAPQAVQAGLAQLGKADADGVVQMKGAGRLF